MCCYAFLILTTEGVLPNCTDSLNIRLWHRCLAVLWELSETVSQTGIKSSPGIHSILYRDFSLEGKYHLCYKV